MMKQKVTIDASSLSSIIERVSPTGGVFGNVKFPLRSSVVRHFFQSFGEITSVKKIEKIMPFVCF